MRKIGVGVCTFKRPDFLSNCLRSLEGMELPADANLCIIIADNDPQGSGNVAVEEFKQTSRLSVYYRVEKNRGIPFARNNVLEQAKEAKVTELAFIDDDETVDKKWLVNLWSYYKESGADVVRSFVKTIYPADTPKWIVKGDFYQRDNFETGTLFDWAATNNVLFNFQRLVISWGCVFDESFGLRGGSDYEYFKRVCKLGAVIKWVDNALVYETLEEARMHLPYFLKRRFRVLNTDYQTRGNLFARLLRIGKAFLKCTSGLIAAPFLLISGTHKAVKALSFSIDGLAVFLASFRIYPKWDEYK